MSPNSVLFRYISRAFLLWFFYVLLGLLCVILVFDSVELLRRAAGKPDATVSIVLQMALFKLPDTGEKVVPFVVLFSAMYSLWRLTRSQELVVARASGVSVWQFLGPVICSAFLIGVINISAVNPLTSHLVRRYEAMESRYLRQQQSEMHVGEGGLWLRQMEGKQLQVIHASSFNAKTMELSGPVMVLLFDAEDSVNPGRIDARMAKLLPGHWELRDCWVNQPKQNVVQEAVRELPTDLTLARIQESFAAPESMSFWELPTFISRMEATGFAARKYRVHYQSLLAQPALLCAMVLLAAAFSLRQTRRGGTLPLVISGAFAGLLLVVITDVVQAFGVSETIPVTLAAWTPAGVSLLLGIATLLHLEDG